MTSIAASELCRVLGFDKPFMTFMTGFNVSVEVLQDSTFHDFHAKTCFLQRTARLVNCVVGLKDRHRNDSPQTETLHQQMA